MKAQPVLRQTFSRAGAAERVSILERHLVETRLHVAQDCRRFSRNDGHTLDLLIQHSAVRTRTYR